MRKYQVLLAKNYLFVDSDVVFLKNPEKTFDLLEGFITSCCHWHNPDHTTTPQVVKLLASKTTTWQKGIFNSGQFACGQQLYTLQSIKKVAHSEWARDTVLNHPFHEQPGMNLLIHAAGIRVVNLTLPPYLMESTWAGDYDQGFEQFWADDARKPFLIHWAGRKMNGQMPIDELFLQYLSQDERSSYISDHARRSNAVSRNLLVAKIANSFKLLVSKMSS
jgi:hypothetical protein